MIGKLVDLYYFAEQQNVRSLHGTIIDETLYGLKIKLDTDNDQFFPYASIQRVAIRRT